jgi:hypothetical protein
MGVRGKKRKTFREQQEIMLKLFKLYEEKLDEIIFNQNILALKLGIDLEAEKRNTILSLFGSDDEQDHEIAKELQEKFMKTVQEKINRWNLFGRL